MRVICYTELPEIRAQVVKYLSYDEAAYHMPLSLVLSDYDDWAWGARLHVVVSDHDDVLLLSLYAPPYLLLPALPVHIDVDPEAIDALVGVYVQEGIAIHGVLGNTALIEAFDVSYTLRSSCVSSVIDKQYALKATQVEDIPLVEGTLYYAAPDDVYFLPYWLGDFRASCGMDGSHIAELYDEVNADVHNEHVFTWHNADGMPCCMATVKRRTPNAAVITRVYTPPYLRCKGYATSCVHALTAALIKQYGMAVLCANVDNDTANHVYETIGYSRVCEQWALRYSEGPA